MRLPKYQTQNDIDFIMITGGQNDTTKRQISRHKHITKRTPKIPERKNNTYIHRQMDSISNMGHTTIPIRRNMRGRDTIRLRDIRGIRLRTQPRRMAVDIIR